MKTRLLLLLLIVCNVSYALDTKLIIRAKAKDAKFIGSSIGGAYVIVKNAMTNQVLAEGKTEGATGNTALIMNTPLKRGSSLSEETTAKFMTILDIAEPTFVSIEVFAPVNKKQATAQASTQLWLIPGKHILGDGILIEVPGFILDILAPRTHEYISLAEVADEPIKLSANVVMMCGCPVSKGGVWDSEKVEVTAIIKKEGENLKDVPLTLISKSLFEGNFLITETGHYEVIIYAYDASTGNTGVDKVNYVVRQ